MTTFDIEQIDKSKFVCFQLKDESVYFGEVQYINIEENNHEVLHDPKHDPEAKNKGKSIRHGFGIQLFGTTQENFICKYEGYWNRDKMHGNCKCFYPDKSFYEGQMKYGQKDGFGKFTWSNGDVYEGNWKNNRMEGGGTFQHHEGSTLKGLFKNNYYVKQGDVFINPFFSSAEIEEFLKRRNEINQLKEKNKKQKLFFFEKTHQVTNLHNLIKKSNKNNRIPLVFSSKQSNLKMGELFDTLKGSLKREWSDFDLRKVQDAKKKDEHKEYLKQVKTRLSNTLALGQIFIINLDDSDVHYDEIFYPDIREFYMAGHFPQQIWNFEELRKSQVYEKIVADTKNSMKFISEDFTILVWTKYKLDQALDDKRIIEKIERRLSSILPMIKLDFIMYTSQDQINEQIGGDPQSQQQSQQQAQ